MEIRKLEEAELYSLMLGEITILFDRFKKDQVGVSLYRDGTQTASLYFEQATEFYRAWRAMQ